MLQAPLQEGVVWSKTVGAVRSRKGCATEQLSSMYLWYRSLYTRSSSVSVKRQGPFCPIGPRTLEPGSKFVSCCDGDQAQLGAAQLQLGAAGLSGPVLVDNMRHVMGTVGESSFSQEPIVSQCLY